MRKMPTLFVRDYTKRPIIVTPEVTPGCEWVLSGEGTATRKWDGACCMIRDKRLYKRYDAKHGKKPPEGFEPCGEPDPMSGHNPGWLLVHPESKADKYFMEGYKAYIAAHSPENGTYELVGPKVNGNNDNWLEHILMPHGLVTAESCPRTFDELAKWFELLRWEGIVWHHSDGRMCKLKRSDFGYPWPIKEPV